MQNHSPLYPWKEQSFFRGMMRLMNEEGIRGLTLGLYATLLRECIYSTIRMGTYEPILSSLHHHLNPHSDNENHSPSPSLKYLSSLLSGGFGAAIANPIDLIKIQFQSVGRSSSSPSAPSLPYQTTRQGLQYILRTHGVQGLWRGSLPTITRAAIVTSSVLGSYDSIKNNLCIKYFHFQDGLQLQFLCSLLAGVITTLTSNPSTMPSPPPPPPP